MKAKSWYFDIWPNKRFLKGTSQQNRKQAKSFVAPWISHHHRTNDCSAGFHADKMKVSSAWALLLGLVSLPTHSYEFTSARDFNLCNALYAGGYGYGRVTFTTLSASCINTKKMTLRCYFLIGPWRPRPNSEYTCVGDQWCIPPNPSQFFPDAGCITILQPKGLKRGGDSDNYACSSGLNIGDNPLYLLSSISTDNPIYSDANTMTECTVIRSGTTQHLYIDSPCTKQSTLIELAARTSYQACIQLADTLRDVAVSFTWHLSAPGKLARDLEGKRLSAEMFSIDNSTSSSGNFRVVVDL
ncbi:hypothetical protein FKW77_000639 [Venturia effusa]|uniref:Uncharacterized protein n=1 Tax=Venturia effusa TaxID=50376 RepID=A0A517LM24_9PEZI|nr:hypothetical protein FKW77_000639 [Venturia effusa]